MKYLILLFILVGCAHMEAQNAVDRLQARLQPFVGKSQKAVLKEFGVPDAIQNVQDTTVFRYRISYGVRHTTAYNLYNGKPIPGTEGSHEQFDSYDVFFEKNKVIDFKIRTQR